MKRLLKFLLRTFLFLFILLNIVVMFHAYKFTHYYDAGEVTIKKSTDKTGWDKARELFFGFNAIKIKDTIPDSSYKTIYLETADHLRLEAWQVNIPDARGTIAMFHGHGG